MAKSDDNLPIDREMFWYCQNVCFGELCWWMVGWRVENYWTRIFAHQSFILRQRQKIGDHRFLPDVRLCVRWMNWWSMTMDCDDDGPALVCELMMTEYLSDSGDKAKLIPMIIMVTLRSLSPDQDEFRIIIWLWWSSWPPPRVGACISDSQIPCWVELTHCNIYIIHPPPLP